MNQRPDLARPETFPSWYDFEQAQRVEEARQRARNDAKRLAEELGELRRTRRSHDQVHALADGLETLLASMRQVSARRWEGGRVGPELGSDPRRWPTRIDTRGYCSL